MTQHSRNCPPPDDGCEDCKDKDNATQSSINAIRINLCKQLYDSKGSVSQQETKFTGENEVFEEKKCMFLHTEENYRRYRNLEICVGTELLQTNDIIKTNVAKIKELNKNLNSTLVNLAKQIKEAKSKFGDLRTAADYLKRGYEDKCNADQKKALTGKTSENCDEPQNPPIDPCKDADNQINQLICIPQGLTKDIDYIFQASSDVVGIQIFSNIDSLEPLQAGLSDKSQKFEKLINDAMKTRKGNLDKLQDDLIVSVKSITAAAMARNSARSDFEGYFDTVDFLCCPHCDCVNENPNEEQKNGDCMECAPRLKDCESRICEICDEVKTTFCCSDTSTNDNHGKENNSNNKNSNHAYKS
jgi:hypothetical protein